VKRGEIRWLRFPKPDKERPVLLLTRDSVRDLLAEISVAPITRTIRDIPTEVVLDEADGMPQRCAVNLDHVQTVPKARLGARVTALDSARMREVGRALLFAYGFDRTLVERRPDE
jgi:mRNA interferase MazF